MITNTNEYLENCVNASKPVPGMLDEYIRLNCASLTAIASRPGMGKTSFALDLALEFAMSTKKCVYIFSYELLAKSVFDRLLAKVSEVDVRKVRDGCYYGDDRSAVNRGREILNMLNFIVDDEPYNGVEDMLDRLSKVEDLGMVVVDYFDIMIPWGSVSDPKSVLAGMKGVSRKFGIPVLFTKQLPRTIDRRRDKKPLLSDLDEFLVRNVDTVLFPYRKGYYDGFCEKDAQISISMNRCGTIGVTSVGWSNECMKFYKKENCDENF